MVYTFPAFNRAFNLATDYCSIERVFNFLHIYYAKNENLPIKFDAPKHYSQAIEASHAMYDEFEGLKKSTRFQDKEMLKALIQKIRLYIKDERIQSFKLSAISMIERFNQVVKDNFQIPTGEILTDYFKDGYVVTDHFRDNANYILSQYDLDHSPDIETNSEPSSQGYRLPLNLNLKQLLYLFQVLQKVDLIKSVDIINICTALSNSFLWESSSNDKSASVKHMQNTWANANDDGKAATFWYDKFIEMSNKIKNERTNKKK